ncbi:MAG: hypothetical protein SWK76_13815 [Actinomycetota bacterium]|nr:hypothetical protein [Actinomycetota bacterium]
MHSENMEIPGLGERYREKESGKDFTCDDCPVAKFFGACEHMCSFLQSMENKNLYIHMANARKEILLGIKSLVEEAIRMEDERVERRKKAAEKSGKGEEKLQRIEID